MAETTGNPRDTPRATEKISGWLFAFLKFFWIAIILAFVVGVLASVVAAVVPGDFSNLMKNITGWIFGNFLTVGLIAVILALLTWIVYRGRRRDAAPASPPSPVIPLAPIVTIDNKPETTIDNSPRFINTYEPRIEINIPALTHQNTPQPATAPAVADEKEIEQRYLDRMIRATEKLILTGIPAGLIAPDVPLEDVFIPLQFFPKRLESDYPLTREEYKRYFELLRQGYLPEDMQQIFFGKEKEYERLLRAGDRLSIAELWQSISRERPAAVVQGYPGMGKSTLMARLTLHFARRGRQLPDPTMGQPPETDGAAPIPILLLLKEYQEKLARAIENGGDLPVMEYMKIALARLDIPGLFHWIQRCLLQGRCLVIFDGLDEVSDLNVRKRVKEAIETFVLNYSIQSRESYNRFIVTSRVAGYDVVAFAGYTHFTVAELTPEQIENFLPRWCRASTRRSSGGQPEAQERVASEAAQMARRLIDTVKTHVGVRKLAENPLLLTLLAVMQQNSIDLPRRRVELYTVVNNTLLENRNIAKDLLPIPEALAIQRLGPIAFAMQEQGNSFAHQREVRASLAKTIGSDGGTPEEISREVGSFLARIRERGGLFVIRTGDYFGFFHRTFQEYFAARYILNQVKLHPDEWIDTLVTYARNAGDTWREVFLLAVAYQSGEDETVARKIIARLLEMPLEKIPSPAVPMTACWPRSALSKPNRSLSAKRWKARLSGSYCKRTCRPRVFPVLKFVMILNRLCVTGCSACRPKHIALLCW